MTVAIKELKEKPLLNQPREGAGWARVTVSDVGKIVAALEHCKAQKAGLLVAEIQFHLKELGFPQKVSDADKGNMRDYITKFTGGWSVGEMYTYMKGLDVPWELTPGNRENIGRVLDGQRILKGGGEGLAKVHLYLKVMGMREEVTKDDKRKMRESLADLRWAGRADSIAEMLYRMRELDLTVEVTDEDKRVMRDGLTRLRRAGAGQSLARMLFHLQKIMPPEGTQTTPPMPPLRKWGGVR